MDVQKSLKNWWPNMSEFHVKVNVYHRPANGGVYIARYPIRGAERYLEGYGKTIGEALEELGKLVQHEPDANGRRFSR